MIDIEPAKYIKIGASNAAVYHEFTKLVFQNHTELGQAGSKRKITQIHIIPHRGDGLAEGVDPEVLSDQAIVLGTGGVPVGLVGQVFELRAVIGTGQGCKVHIGP